jgi:AraC-like DNA-binding protein
MNRKLSKVEDWEKLAKESNFKPGIMAAKCPVSLRHLQRFFIEHFNETPGEWSRALRLRLALEFISHGWSNKAASAELGFADESHFCHEFKRVYGAPPQAFGPLYGVRKADTLPVSSVNDMARRFVAFRQECRV